MEDVILLDTGILFDYFVNGPMAGFTEEILSEGRGAVSAVTVFELFRGVRKKVHLEQRKKILAFVHAIDFNSAIAIKAGDIYTALRSTGVTIDNEDILIGATAIHYNMEVFTGNQKHFNNIPGIRYFNYK